MRDEMGECEDVAHAEGLAAGLATALARAGEVDPPGGVVALPASHVPEHSTRIHHHMAAREGIAFLRRPGTAGAPDGEAVRVAALLAAVRIGVSRRVVAAAVRHLSSRTVGGEPTLGKQLVQGALADALAEIEVLRQRLLAPTRTPGDMADVHDRLTALDWETVKLFGASGYVVSSPAQGAYISRLVANCWVAGASTV